MEGIKQISFQTVGEVVDFLQEFDRDLEIQMIIPCIGGFNIASIGRVLKGYTNEEICCIVPVNDAYSAAARTLTEFTFLDSLRPLN